MLSLSQSFAGRNAVSLAAACTARRPPTIDSNVCIQQVRWMAGGKRPKVALNSHLKRLPSSIKMRHVQRFCDVWFSADHLRSDIKLKSHIQSNKGWCQFKLLLNRSKFRDWTNESLLKDTFLTAPRTYQIKEEGGQKFVQRYDIQEQLAESKLPGPKPPELDLYDSDREVVVHENADDSLNETCRRLSEADCLGMGVEFAQLPGHDITRPPAMIKLASEDLVALIWLHKFPDHGKSVLKDSAYYPLLKLLASNIPKVGVSLPKSVRQLAFFWGMTSKSDFIRHQRKAIDQNFKQLIDLRGKHADGKNLYVLCSRILGVRLRSNRYLRSSYRSDRLSHKLKEYAAREAACQLDIWRAIQEKEARFRQNSRSGLRTRLQPPSSRRSKARSRL